MDIWSYDELEACRAALYPLADKEITKLRFTEFGGVVRHVLGNPHYSFDAMKARIGIGIAKDAVSLNLMGTREEISHSVYHIRVRSLFRSRCDQPMSQPTKQQ